MKRMAFLMILVLVLAGCGSSSVQTPVGPPTNTVIDTEKISDSVEVLTVESELGDETWESQTIKYEKDGKVLENYFNPWLRPSFDWISENVGEDSVILSWWDYGHMIKGYTNRDVVLYSPSEDILWTVASGEWDVEGSGPLSSHEKILDVVSVLTTEEPAKVIEIMDQYDADYLFLTAKDSVFSAVLFYLGGLNTEEYQTKDGPKEKALATMLYRMIGKEEIDGLELVYFDDLVRIYGVSEQ
ncbi:hypothetical protein ACFLYT_00675 [Nanoarchaeota archaeon]